MEPSWRSEGGSSGSVEIMEALTEVIKVLKFLRRDMVTGFGEVVNAFNKEYLEQELSKEDSEPELEVTLGELMDLAAESEEGEWYQEWLVETGRVRKSDEEVEEKVEEKKDEEHGEKGKEVEIAVEYGCGVCVGSDASLPSNSFCF